MTEFKNDLSQFEIKDPYSGKLFVPKRPNQRFSCKENQIKFNNLKAKKIREKTAYINKPLQNNFRILEQLLLNKKEITVHNQYLLGKGFSFEIYTGVDEYEKKKQFTIYGFIFIPVDKELIKIVKL